MHRGVFVVQDDSDRRSDAGVHVLHKPTEAVILKVERGRRAVRRLRERENASEEEKEGIRKTGRDERMWEASREGERKRLRRKRR